MTTPPELLACFKRRRDKQIMGLELLAISLGLHTFDWLLYGQRVVIHCDNKGAEASVRRGSAVQLDHAQLVHEQWFEAARAGLSIFVQRVATDDNIADVPSREVRFTSLGRAVAMRVRCRLARHGSSVRWERSLCHRNCRAAVPRQEHGRCCKNVGACRPGIPSLM